MSRYPPQPQPGFEPYHDPYAREEQPAPYSQEPYPSRPADIRFAPSPQPYQQPMAATSGYTLHDDEKEGYGSVPSEEEDEVRPLANYPAGYGEAGSGYGRQQGLSRRETSAEAWQKRQQTRLGRAKTKKVRLGRQGNYIVEMPVPTAIANANRIAVENMGGGNDHPEEFTHLRYTACTDDPDDFTAERGWSLRISNYGRTTDTIVTMTSYNEDKVLLARTLHATMTNVSDMVRSKYSEFRRQAEKSGGEGGIASGDDAWKRIAVVLVFDGIDPADKLALDVLATIGIYQDAIMKRAVDGKETVCHIFEYTTALSMSPKPALVLPQKGDRNGLVPVQMILCLKQRNQKKINSHRWLFNGLGRHLQPDVCILLDVGTKPSRNSLYYLWEAFYHNKNLGGACGEIHAMLGRGGKKLINPLVASQNFEYKMSNILDKPTESSFGYVSVLPGAFSAYRYRAIQGRPLEQYFHGDHSLADRLGDKGIMGMSIFKKNMFLAEDRILCFELAAKANSQWTLGYVKPAKGETDVPEQAAELIGQRRRWLNGSFAAGVYSLVHFPRFYRSNHNILRMFFFHIQAIYNAFNLFMSWFQLANFFLTFSIIIDIVARNWHDPLLVTNGDISTPMARKTVECWSGSPFLQQNSTFQSNTELRKSNIDGFLHEHDVLDDFNWALKVLYLTTLAIQIILALGNRPKGERLAYALSFWIFAILAAYLIFMTVILTIAAFCPIGTAIAEEGGNVVSVLLGTTFGPIMAGIIGTFGIYIISSAMYLDPWHIFHSMPQYLLVAPSFCNVLMVYAFCNLHDVSWGTKGSDKADALPTVETKKTDGKGAEVEIAEKIQEDIDSQFEQTVKRAVAPMDTTEEIERPTPDDQNKTFRTRLVGMWLFSNAILSVTISRLSSEAQSKYFTFLLVATFGLSIVRFAGFLWYLTGETIFRMVRLCTRRSK